MKLLLDEHLSPEIARSLRERGHDVVAVAERPDLRRGSDSRIITAAAAEMRVVVTGDLGDFISLGSRRLPSRKPHLGVVLVPHHAFPLSRGGVGRIVRALAELLAEHPREDGLAGEIILLRRATGNHD